MCSSQNACLSGRLKVWGEIIPEIMVLYIGRQHYVVIAKKDFSIISCSVTLEMNDHLCPKHAGTFCHFF